MWSPASPNPVVHPLVLASASPRRAALLRQVGLPHVAVAAEVDEAVPGTLPPREAVQVIAQRKARALPTGPWVLAADTLGDLDGRALGKPEGPREAVAMLLSLQDRSHLVHTGLVVRHVPSGREWSRVETTRVTFAPLTAQQAEAYVATGEPLGKAGAYAIQGIAGAYVTRLEGDYYNVMGLPLAATLALLEEAGYPLPVHLRPA